MREQKERSEREQARLSPSMRIIVGHRARLFNSNSWRATRRRGMVSISGSRLFISERKNIQSTRFDSEAPDDGRASDRRESVS
jgi:hypothetical protein